MFINFVVKCYLQSCYRDESGWNCIHEKEGDVKEQQGYVCHEKLGKRDGKEYTYVRDVIRDNASELKEGCATKKWKLYEEEMEDENCYCLKDFCNAKYKYPDGAKYHSSLKPWCWNAIKIYLLYHLTLNLLIS